jgi:P4 family phage/plasmid primase-like protien
MDKSLNQFIKPYLVYRDEERKHNFSSQLKEQTGLFSIPGDSIEKFWDLYCAQLSTNGSNFISGLCERPQEFRPVLGDIDIHFYDDEDKLDCSIPFYKEKHVRHVVSIYQDVLKYLVKGYSPENLYCFVLEKTKPHREEKKVKNGFHLHFPFLYLNKLDISANLFDRIKNRIEEEQVFKDIGIEHSGELIDKGMEKKYWLLYGSRKAINKEPYLFTKLYNHKCEVISLESIKNEIKIFNSDEDLIDLSNIHNMLPRILSTNSFRRPTFEVKDEIEQEYKTKLPKASNIKRYNDDLPVPELIEEAKKLLDIMSSCRADNYETWLEVGLALYNISEGSEEGLDLWLDFSSKTSRDNYDEKVCIKSWKGFTKGNWSIASFIYWAKQDNKEKYEDHIKQKNKNLMKENLEGNHYDLAKQLHLKYTHQFVCANVKENIWFEFRGHRWVEIDSGSTLRSKIALELVPRYIELGKEYNERYRDADVGETKSINDAQIKIGKLIQNLKNTGFKDQIMKECRHLFLDETFFRKLNKNLTLLGFDNGVLDLKSLEFRDGKPEDFLSMTTGYDFKSFTDEDPEIYDIKIFLTKIFPDPDLRTYFLNWSSSILRGGNTDKSFIVMTGEQGDNGKSVTIDLLKHMLGDYFASIPVSYLTQTRSSSGSASPELARCADARLVVGQEPSKDTKIQSDKLKELTGSDNTYIRTLYSKGGDVKFNFKLALVTNKLPRMDSDEQAVWNRVRVLPYEAVFPKDRSLVPDDFKEQLKKKMFERDDFLFEKFDYMKRALMWVCYQTFIHLRKTASNKKLNEPYKVTEATRLYRQRNDFFLQFVNEEIKEDKNGDHDGITLTEVYARFSEWYKETFGVKSSPNKNDVKEDLYKRWGVPRAGRWRIYRFRDDRDDVEEGIALNLTEQDLTDGETTADEYEE